MQIFIIYFSIGALYAILSRKKVIKALKSERRYAIVPLIENDKSFALCVLIVGVVWLPGLAASVFSRSDTP